MLAPPGAQTSQLSSFLSLSLLNSIESHRIGLFLIEGVVEVDMMTQSTGWATVAPPSYPIWQLISFLSSKFNGIRLNLIISD